MKPTSARCCAYALDATPPPPRGPEPAARIALKEGYDSAYLLRLAGNLKGKLLLVAMTSDVSTFSPIHEDSGGVHPGRQALRLIVLPEQGHVPSGTSRTYWLEAVRRYFQDHLKP